MEQKINGKIVSQKEIDDFIRQIFEDGVWKLYIKVIPALCPIFFARNEAQISDFGEKILVSFTRYPGIEKVGGFFSDQVSEIKTGEGCPEFRVMKSSNIF